MYDVIVFVFVCICVYTIVLPAYHPNGLQAFSVYHIPDCADVVPTYLRWYRSLPPRWQALLRRNAQGLPDPQGQVYAAPYRCDLILHCCLPCTLGYIVLIRSS